MQVIRIMLVKRLEMKKQVILPCIMTENHRMVRRFGV